jgi:hypothetical protein
VPGAPFFLAAALVVAAMLVAWRTTRPAEMRAATDPA